MSENPFTDEIILTLTECEPEHVAMMLELTGLTGIAASFRALARLVLDARNESRLP